LLYVKYIRNIGHIEMKKLFEFFPVEIFGVLSSMFRASKDAVADEFELPLKGAKRLMEECRAVGVERFTASDYIPGDCAAHCLVSL
jgi:hypothetical protein